MGISEWRDGLTPILGLDFRSSIESGSDNNKKNNRTFFYFRFLYSRIQLVRWWWRSVDLISCDIRLSCLPAF